MGVLKFPKLKLPRLWRPITLFANLWLEWGLKKNCSPLPELSNGMWHATCMKGNQGDSQLLMVLSFGHNLCFKYPNGSCEPILDIYVPRAFSLYEIFCSSMGFDPCNHYLKNQKSIRTLTPKVGVHLGVWRFIPSHSPTLLGAWNVTLKLHSWPTPSQALTLVASPRLGLWHHPWHHGLKTLFFNIKSKLKLIIHFIWMFSHLHLNNNLKAQKKFITKLKDYL